MRFFLVIAVLVLGLFFAGCTGTAPAIQPAENAPAPPAQHPAPQQNFTCPSGEVVTSMADCPLQQPLPVPAQAGDMNATGNAENATDGNRTKAGAEEMKRGTADPSFEVATYDPEKVYPGTTLLPDNHDLDNPRIVEVNMLGEVLWEYYLPAGMKQYTNPGFDAEVLGNGNILFTLPRKGVYEIDRGGKIVWSYPDPKVSHDADRLPDGNTLIAFGAYDGKNDAQAKEVSPGGKVVWSYYAKNHFGSMPAYKDISSEGWTHTNGVMRLANGNTVVSHRNFNLLAEVDAQGNVVRTVEGSEFVAQHDPAYLPDGNLLFATHTTPQKAVELDSNNTVVWSFIVRERNAWPVRDADRLPNGNTLITAADRILEVTPAGETVWAFRMKGVTFASQTEYASRGFYKAQRIAP